jgi:hypothetical protein
MRPLPKILTSTAALAVIATLLAGCGESESGSASRPAPSSADFPSSDGRTLEELLAEAEPSDLVASPAGQVFDKGANRYPFGVFTVGREQVADAEVAMYFARGPKGEATGPFPARVESLTTDPAFVAKTTASDPDAATVAYTVPRVRFDGDGEWRVLAMIRVGDSVEATRVPSLVVGDFPKVPDAGEKAPSIHTPTVDDVGDVNEIETRIPPDTMHEIDYADAYGERPIVLMFATPALCQSRVCGPVVDIQEQVASELRDEAAFIHMEVYEDNDPNRGLRPQLKAFHLPTEPWVFVLDEEGVISTRIEGPVSVEDLERAVRGAL